MALLKSAGQLAECKGRLALAGHRPTVAGPDAARLEAIEAAFRRALQPSQRGRCGPRAESSARRVRRLAGYLAGAAAAGPGGRGLVFHREAIDRARELLVAHITKQGRLESVDFKYLLDTTRKFALPLLDYFDGLGFLRRVGNTRFLKNPKGA